MASWGAKFAGQSDATDLPKTMEPGKKGDTALEVFVDGALTKIYNESSGRSKDQKSIREACKTILGTSFSFVSASAWLPASEITLIFLETGADTLREEHGEAPVSSPLSKELAQKVTLCTS